MVHLSNPADSVAAFVAAAKCNPDNATLASSGIGSIPQLALEQRNGASFRHIPYKGSAPAITDVTGGQVGAFCGDIPGLIGFVKGGKLKPPGIASASRHSALPDGRTLAEQGIRVWTATTGLRCLRRPSHRRQWSTSSTRRCDLR